MNNTTRTKAEEELLYRLPMPVIFVEQLPICPRCGKGLIKEQQKFCTYCGQKLSWRIREYS